MWLVIALITFVLAVICHLVVIRTSLSVSNVIHYMLVGGVVGMLLAVLLLMQYGMSSETFAALAVFAFLSELYIFLFTLVISSVTISMLLRLLSGSLPESVLTEEAQSSEMVAFRLEQLERNGFIRQIDGNYVPLPTARRVTTVFVALRLLLGHELY